MTHPTPGPGRGSGLQQVLSRDPNKFRASLLWLVDNEAITLAQADRLKDIYDHRHDLTHELIKYVVDVNFEPDVDLFADALTILADIRRFWTQMEIDIGSFEDFGEVDVDDVQLVILSKCIQAYVAGLPGVDQQPS